MSSVHRMMRDLPVAVFALMVALPLVMTVAAIALGWFARKSVRANRRAAGASPGVPRNDALAAGITVGIVPFAVMLLMLWARFG